MDKVQVVTELWLRRETEGRKRPQLIARLEHRYGAPPGLDQGSLYGWETREHEPCELSAAALCRYFRVETTAQLGLGHQPEADAYWTLMTKCSQP